MRNLLKYASSASRQILCRRRCGSGPRVSFYARSFYSSSPSVSFYARPFYSSPPRVSFYARPFCSSNGGGSSSNGDGEASSELTEVEEDLKKLSSALVEDVETIEILKELRKYYGDKDDNLEAIAELVMKRALSRKHDQSDEELMDELQMDVVEDVHDSEFESDFEEAYETDHEIENLYNATEYTEDKLLADGPVEMDAETYDEIVKEMQEKGHVIDQQSLEELVEDMTNWDTLLPEDLKQKIEAKFNELGDMCERGELEPEEAYGLFKEFEDAVVEEYAQKLPSEEIPQDIESKNKGGVYDKDPPGEGPILRWETRMVLSPGGDSWHPANRKVKVSVFVKELGLSKYAFMRLRELVGKRYDAGKGELTIVSERFAHREENRKDCLRTLIALIEEAEKADTYVAEVRTAYTKEQLKANPKFQERLRAHYATKIESQEPSPA